MIFPVVHENVRPEVGGIEKHGDHTAHDLVPDREPPSQVERSSTSLVS